MARARSGGSTWCPDKVEPHKPGSDFYIQCDEKFFRGLKEGKEKDIVKNFLHCKVIQVSVTSYGKIGMNLLANPVSLEEAVFQEEC